MYPTLTPTCAGLLEHKRSRLGLLKSAFNGENFIHSLSWSSSSHFGHWNVCCSLKSWKNLLKLPILKFQDHQCWHFFRKCIASACLHVCASVPICNHFHTRQASNGKITSCLEGVTFLFVGTLFTQRHEILLQNTRDPWLSYDENPKSLPHLALDRYRDVTPERTDRITVANTHCS